jgi:hypothetical protein
MNRRCIPILYKMIALSNEDGCLPLVECLLLHFSVFLIYFVKKTQHSFVSFHSCNFSYFFSFTFILFSQPDLVLEPHELKSRQKYASEDTPDDYTINVEVRRHSLWLSVQGGAEKTGSHPSQRIELLSEPLPCAKQKT